MTVEEMEGPAGLHHYNQEQGPLATESLRSQSIIPLDRLAKYLKSQIDERQEKQR
jgi:hypothetical protein